MIALPQCDYRVPDGTVDGFYCRHTEVHAPGNQVSPGVCRTCTRRFTPCFVPRLLPVDPLYSQVEQARNRPWEYVSTNRMIADLRQFLGRLPCNLTAVAGIPRSGMLPAAYLATMLHVPLLAACRGCGLWPLGHGLRLDGHAALDGPILVVDDSVYRGTAIHEARGAIRREYPNLDVIYAGLYPRPEAATCVDLYVRLIPEAHLFEWNLFNASQTRHFAFDFDGIFCEDWQGTDDDGDAYLQFVENAKPKWLPRRCAVPLIVTARLERYRPATEAWLDRHGVRVDRLVMGSWASSSARRNAYRAGEYKGQHYARSRCKLFVESDDRQAAEIFEVARRPVLCPGTERIYQS